MLGASITISGADEGKLSCAIIQESCLWSDLGPNTNTIFSLSVGMYEIVY